MACRGRRSHARTLVGPTREARLIAELMSSLDCGTTGTWYSAPGRRLLCALLLPSCACGVGRCGVPTNVKTPSQAQVDFQPSA